MVKRELCHGEDIPKTNRRYWPSDRDIYNNIYAATRSLRQGKLDLDNLDAFQTKWKDTHKDDLVEYFPSALTNDPPEPSTDFSLPNSGFLFVYQSKQQKHLMERYGNDIVLMDATYKTTRYALPLFFLCVPANCCYMTIGMFITQYETKDSIKRALEVFQEHNPDWKPKAWMTDCCEAEKNAIKATFPGK
jgi:hypothetical protein